MIYTINNEVDINALPENVAAGTVLLHKKMEYSTLCFLMSKKFPTMKIGYAHPGTEVYTNHGANTSVIVSLT